MFSIFARFWSLYWSKPGGWEDREPKTEENLNRPGSLMMRTSMFLSDREISYLEIEKYSLFLYAICHLYLPSTERNGVWGCHRFWKNLKIREKDGNGWWKLMKDGQFSELGINEDEQKTCKKCKEQKLMKIANFVEKFTLVSKRLVF